MSNSPTFSVIMACHNAAPYVQRAIESVVCQTFTDWELIIVDDASQDDSLIYIKKAVLTDERIKFLSTTANIGAAAARNAAIEIAKGEWLAILDADDVFLPYKLEKQFEIIQQRSSNLVLLGAGCFLINSDGLRIRSRAYRYSSRSKVLKKALGRPFALKFPPHSSIVYRKSSFLKVGGFNPIFQRSEDYALWLRLSEIGDISASALPLIEYRFHSTSISNQISKQGFSQFEYGAAIRVCQLLRNSGHADPSATGNDQLWHELMTQVAKIIRQSKYYKYCDWKSAFKNKWQRSTKFVDRLMIITSQIAPSNFFFFYFIREYTSGTGLAGKIFKSWITR
jgi:glycosyltransferase involved in cell wall biosynthesis